MSLIADTNTFLAVAFDEPEKSWLIRETKGRRLIAPNVLPYEIGNALTAMLKRSAILPGEITGAWDAIQSIPVELRPIEVRSALAIAARLGIYAYDAYFLECALETRLPLLTLDQGLRSSARRLDIPIVEKEQ